MSEGKMTRRERLDRVRARAWALQVHYRWESGGFDGTLRDALVDVVRTRCIAERRLPYLRALLTEMDQRLPEIDGRLQEALDNWKLERLSRIDRAILRIGATELLYFDDVPPKVAIQEAIRLAEAYGGEDSPRFVNGVLDALYKASRAEES